MSVFKRIIALLFAVVCAFSMNMCVFASSELSLTVECAYEEELLSGVNVKIYFVAKEISRSEYMLTKEFEKYSIMIDDYENPEQLKSAALAIETYVERDSIAPYDYSVTDADGKVKFPVHASKLEKGVYLVVTDAYETEKGVYDAEPFLVILSNDSHMSSIITKPKFFDKEIFFTTTVKVLKIWEDGVSERPEKIEIELILDGKVVDTVILSEKTNWRYMWKDLKKGDYSVCEKSVPDGYRVSVSHEGITFVIKNTASEMPPDEEDTTTGTTVPQEEPPEKLPQTGMLKWPVPYLACAGILLVMAGWVINRKNEIKNEK